MRENRTYGSEGGETGLTGLPCPYQDRSVLMAADGWMPLRMTDREGTANSGGRQRRVGSERGPLALGCRCLIQRGYL
jgi:hypothetical protein